MTQYHDRVIKRAKQIAAEEWARGVKSVHSHSLNSMWYEPEPEVVKEVGVLDIEYNDGRITRNGEEVIPSQLKNDRLIDEWERFNNELS